MYVSSEVWEEMHHNGSLDIDEYLVMTGDPMITEPSTRYVSKELVTSINFAGWRVQKSSIWKEALDMHIMQIDQVTITIMTCPVVMQLGHPWVQMVSKN